MSTILSREIKCPVNQSAVVHLGQVLPLNTYDYLLRDVKANFRDVICEATDMPLEVIQGTLVWNEQNPMSAMHVITDMNFPIATFSITQAQLDHRDKAGIFLIHPFHIESCIRRRITKPIQLYGTILHTLLERFVPPYFDVNEALNLISASLASVKKK